MGVFFTKNTSTLKPQCETVRPYGKLKSHQSMGNRCGIALVQVLFQYLVKHSQGKNSKYLENQKNMTFSWFLYFSLKTIALLKQNICSYKPCSTLIFCTVVHNIVTKIDSKFQRSSQSNKDFTKLLKFVNLAREKKQNFLTSANVVLDFNELCQK